MDDSIFEDFFGFDLPEGASMVFLNGITNKTNDCNICYDLNGKSILIKLLNVDKTTREEITEFAQNKICDFELNYSNKYIDVQRITNYAIKENDIKALDCINYLLTIKQQSKND